MTQFHARVVSTALVNKGLVEQETSHHTPYILDVAGRRRRIRTRLSHGQRKVEDWLLSERKKFTFPASRPVNWPASCRLLKRTT